MNRKLLTAALLAALASAGCATTPTVDRYVAPPQGSTWVNATQASGSFGSGSRQIKTTMGTETWQGRGMIAFHGDPLVTVSTDEGCWVAQLRGGKPLVSWDPPICMGYPYTVGDSRTRKIRVTNEQTKQVTEIEARWKVEAYEEISVPAGRLPAFRIAYADDIGNERMDWFNHELGIFLKSSVKRSAKHPAGAGTIESELVSHTIRR